MQPDSGRRGPVAALLLLLTLPSVLPAQSLPRWLFAPEAKDSLRRLWAESIATNREHVGCLGGTIGLDTVRVDQTILLDDAPGDSLNAPAEPSLATCGPPRWIGTVHTHVRSTDDPSPAPRFSGSDRVVMSVWVKKWRSRGRAACSTAIVARTARSILPRAPPFPRVRTRTTEHPPQVRVSSPGRGPISLQASRDHNLQPIPS